MIIFWLGLALWLLFGVQGFVLLVRRKAKLILKSDYASVPNECCVKLVDGVWKIRLGRSFKPIGVVFILYATLGLWSLVDEVFENNRHWLSNLGFRFVAKDIIPLEIARKLVSEEGQ